MEREYLLMTWILGSFLPKLRAEALGVETVQAAEICLSPTFETVR